MELKKLFNYEVVISASDNSGIIVKIGCGVFCYSGIESFLHDLRMFLTDPDKWEKAYNQEREAVGTSPRREEEPEDTCEPPQAIGSDR